MWVNTAQSRQLLMDCIRNTRCNFSADPRRLVDIDVEPSLVYAFDHHRSCSAHGVHSPFAVNAPWPLSRLPISNLGKSFFRHKEHKGAQRLFVHLCVLCVLCGEN
jgi:hypothetical protein